MPSRKEETSANFSRVLLLCTQLLPGRQQKLDAPQILCLRVSLKKFHISPGFTTCHVLSLTFTRWEAFGRRSWGQTAITCHLLFNSVHLHCGQTDGRNKNYGEETRFSMVTIFTWYFHGWDFSSLVEISSAQKTPGDKYIPQELPFFWHSWWRFLFEHIIGKCRFMQDVS